MRLSRTGKKDYRYVQLVQGTKDSDGTFIYCHKSDFDKADTDKVREYVLNNPEWEKTSPTSLVTASPKNIDDCFDIPSSAPSIDKASKSKSKKVFKLGLLYFFMRDTANGVWIYSIDLGKQLLWAQDKTKAMNLLVRRLDEVKDLVNEKSV